MARSGVVRALTIRCGTTYRVTVEAEDASAAKNCTSLMTPSNASSTASTRVEDCLVGSSNASGSGSVLPEPTHGRGVGQAEMQPQELGGAAFARQVGGLVRIDRPYRPAWREQ